MGLKNQRFAPIADKCYRVSARRQGCGRAGRVELQLGEEFPLKLEERAATIGGVLLVALSVYVVVSATWALWLGRGQEFSDSPHLGCGRSTHNVRLCQNQTEADR
jgi:hypothetical protein